MAKKKQLSIIAAAGICAAAAGMLAFGEERPAADKINNSSIIIGTYLIDFEALNEEIQALAETDARNTNQNKIYYKSELNDGVWYDITDAESVNDIILTNSKIVDNSIIDGLTLTLYFKADGSVVDFSTGETVSKQDIQGQFNPANMSELSALVKQKDIVKELADSTSDEKDKKEVEVLDKVFEPIEDDTCKELVDSMNALDSLISSAEGSAKEAMENVKVKKRAELDNYCREKVSERIDTAIEELTKDDNSAHAELIGMLSDAQSELSANMMETSSQIGAEATDAAGKKQQQLEDQIVAAAKNGDTEGATKAAQTLSVLEAMISGESTDSKAAAELSDEMFKETVSGIESTVSSILDGTHEYYSEGGAGMSSQDVLAQVQTDISDAEQLAKDKAFYKTGSVSSEEYNKTLSEDLSTLGLTLSALSENSGSDELGKQVVSTVRDSADEVLSDAATAKALSIPATAEQKKIEDLESKIDSAYEKYLDALNSSDGSAADAAMEQVQVLEEQLEKLRASIANGLEGLVKELFGEKSSDNPDKDKIHELETQISVDKGYLSDVDNALLEQTLAAVEEMEEAVNSGSVSECETAYDGLNRALKNVPGELLGDDVKADMLEYTASLLEGDNSDMAAEDIGELIDKIKGDITAAENGNFTPDPSQTGDDTPGSSETGDNKPGSSQTGDNTPGSSQTGDEPLSGGDESIFEDLYEFKLIIPSLNIYSNTMSVEKDGAVFLDMNAFAREAGLECFTSGEIFIYRGENVLIELTAKENIAYVGDKLFAPSSPPYFSGDVLYVPIDLVAAGMKLTVVTEYGITFMR